MSLAGMRAADVPDMAFFFLSPFVFSFAAAIVFDTVQGSLPKKPVRKGIGSGLLMVLAYTIPSIFIIFTSMIYPAGFFIGPFLTGIVAYPLMGIPFVITRERLKKLTGFLHGVHTFTLRQVHLPAKSAVSERNGT